MGFGSKRGFDCTKKLPAEGFTREWPDVIEMSPEIKRRLTLSGRAWVVIRAMSLPQFLIASTGPLS